MRNVRQRLLFFAVPLSLAAVVYYPLRYGWTRDAAEHVAMWFVLGVAASVLFGALDSWRERRPRAKSN